MYEAFFGLKRRPFAATPDANCWFHCERYQAALDELLVCAEQGQGIGVVIAPAGAGKTLLCERLIRDIGEPFISVLLRHATYQSRRGFLQTLLSELAQPFDKPSDQELRLALAPVLRGLGQEGKSLLLVVDEAHTLSETLLEELRILADQAQDGKPLVRLVLCGQLALEDKLAHPQLQALNQRIRAHITVTPLNTRESADYLDYRITWAGGRTEELFTPEAQELICRAADGQPRCLNQLCDHALLLAYVAEQRPVTAAHVAVALDDLRHLPFTWNAHTSQQLSVRQDDNGDNNGSVQTDEPREAPAVWESSAPAENIVEWGSSSPSDPQPVEPSQTLRKLPPVLPAMTETDVLREVSDDEVWREEVIVDRYAALDAGLQPPPQEATRRFDTVASVEPLTSDLFEQTATNLFRSATSVEERLDVMQHVLEYVSDGEKPYVANQPRASYLLEQRRTEEPLPEYFGDAADDESIFAESTPDDPRDVDPTDDAHKESAFSAESSVIEVGAPVSSGQIPDETPAAPRAESRQLRNLFTLLRRKQQGRL